MQKVISKGDILEMPRIKRLTFINSVSGYKSASLIGTKSNQGQENLAIFNSLVHIGSNPPMLGFILRPTTVERHSYENIIENGSYTINQVSKHFIEKAHQTSASYERGVSEFSAVGLQPKYRNGFDAPFVRESRVSLAMKFVDEEFIKLNDTRLIIGEVQTIYLKDNLMKDDGFVNLAEAESVAGIGLDTYCSVKVEKRLSYARPNEESDTLNV